MVLDPKISGSKGGSKKGQILKKLDPGQDEDFKRLEHGLAKNPGGDGDIKISYNPVMNRLRRGRSGAHLYLKNNVYYFRYAFSQTEIKRFGRKEIRLSLHTRYVCEARKRAKRLFTELLVMIEVDKMLDYEEIKLRLYNVLLKILNAHDQYKSKDQYIQVGSYNFSRKKIFEEAYKTMKTSVGVSDSIHNSSNYRISQLIDLGVFTKEEIEKSDSYYIVKKYHEIIMICFDIMAKRESGDFTYEIPIINNIKNAINYNSRVDLVSTPKNLLSKLINNYIDSKVADGKCSLQSVPDITGRLDFLIDILGDVYIEDITRDDIRMFRGILQQLPPNRKKSKQFRDKTIEEILKLNSEKRLSVKTVNVVMEAVSSLFGWCVKERILDHNPAQGMQLKDKRLDIQLREPFTDEDLKKIFTHSLFNGKNPKNMAFYWAPYIALYTGMRLEEICQLHVCDIYKNSGIYVIDINDNLSSDNKEDKRIKTKNAKRIIPVHSKLIDLGLIEYRKKIEMAGFERLFPLLKKVKTKDTYGHSVSKKFSNIVKQCEIDGKKSFHSFRHNFSDFFKQKHLHNDIFRQIYGHQINDLAGRQYGSSFSVMQCYEEIISKLHYNIE